MYAKLSMILIAATVTLCVFTSAVSQQQMPARTPTGFYYPINAIFTNDTNWLACGSSYYTNTRHNGADLIYDIGTPVYTIAPGKVLYKSGPAEKSGWGIGNYALVIKHSSLTGDFLALYGHIQTMLNINDVVDGGQQMGTIGPYQETVNGQVIDRKPHLHFGIFPSTSNFPSSGWGRLTDAGCTRPNLTNGFVAPISYIRTKTSSSPPPSLPSTSKRFDLNGEWIASGYPDVGEIRIRVRHVGDKVEATKLTSGSSNVPAGAVTWFGTYTSNSFFGKIQAAEAGFTNRRLVEIIIRVSDDRHLVVTMISDDPVTGGRWGPLKFEKVR